MFWLPALLVWSGIRVGAQSLDPSASNTCIRRSVVIYTSESSTYVVTDLGSTSFAAAPTLCPNVTASTSISTVYGANLTITSSLPASTSISTVYGANVTVTASASTITVYQQPTPNSQALSVSQASSATEPSANPVVVVSSSFQPGSEATFNSSSSSPEVSAQVVTDGPVPPYDDDGYLLITFNDTTTQPARAKRQTSGPLVYNITQVFSATAGTSYVISAWASDAQNGNAVPDCTLTICGQTDCSAPSALTTSYSPYIYVFNAQSTNTNAVAAFSVQCRQAAYVALDNVNIVANGQTPSGATTTVYLTATRTLQASTITQTLQGNAVTRTIQQSPIISFQPTTQLVPITTTQLVISTTSIGGSNVLLTTAVPTIIYSTIIASAPIQTQQTTRLIQVTTTQVLTLTTSLSGSNILITTAVPTTIYSVITASAPIQAQPTSQLVPITTTRIITATANFSGSNVLLTTAIPTVIYSTITATQQIPTTALVTATSIVQVPNTVYASDVSTITTTITQRYNVTETRNVPSLVYETATATTLAVVTQTAFSLSSYALSASTSTITQLTTILLTTTLSQPPSLVYQTITATTTSQLTFTAVSSLPGQTWTTTEGRTILVDNGQTITAAQPASTEIRTSIIYSTQTLTNYVSVTLPRQTDSIPVTLPQATYTPSPQTTYVTLTIPASTITSYISVTPPPVTQYYTSTLPRATQTIAGSGITQTLPQATTQIVQTFTPPPQTVTYSIPGGSNVQTATYTPPALTTTIQQSITQTLPQATSTIVQTFTPPAQTITYTATGSNVVQTTTITPQVQSVTYTLPASTITRSATYTQPAQTITVTYSQPAQAVQTVTYTQPAQTQTVTYTQPAQTFTQPASTIVQTQTVVQPAQTITYTAPAGTVVQTQTFTPAARTVVSTAPAATIRTTAPASTITRTQTQTQYPSTSSVAPAFTYVPPAGVPSIYLPRPTVVAGDLNAQGTEDYDDWAFGVNLPFTISLYGITSDTAVVTSNGVLGWDGGDGTAPQAFYQNNPLPDYSVGDTIASPFWTDTFISRGTQQGIYYQTFGSAPRRQLTFEFYVQRYGVDGSYFHYLVDFYENVPDVVSFRYLNVTDLGEYATVGVQSDSGGQQSLQYSYAQAIIYPGLQLTFNTAASPNYRVDDAGDTTAVVRTAKSSETEAQLAQRKKLSGSLQKRRM